jgi:hypothetical protein
MLCFYIDIYIYIYITCLEHVQTMCYLVMQYDIISSKLAK